jgi:RNA polymerase sigma-70 factor, ECF subfamily
MSTHSQEGQQFDDAVVAAYPALLREALRLTRNDADARDLVQAAIVRALSRRTAFRYGGAPDKWMASILRRMFVDGYRHARTVRQFARARDPIWVGPDDSTEADDDGENARPAAWEAFSIEDVRRAVTLLPDDQRVVYTLFAFEQRSYAEIAARLHVAPGTIASRVFRARRSLRDLLLSGAFRRVPAGRGRDSLKSVPQQAVTAAPPRVARRESWIEKHAA